MFIQTESTPNPATLKFLPGQTVLEVGTADFPTGDAAGGSPLAQRIFAVEGVEGVFFGNDFVTVTKADGVEWYEIKDEIQQHIKKFLEAGKQILTEENVKEDHQLEETDTDLEQKIKSILDEYIRPAVEMDGGAITFGSFEDGQVKVLLQGSCSGCPSSTITLKAGIENLLKRMVPEVQGVVAEEL